MFDVIVFFLKEGFLIFRKNWKQSFAVAFVIALIAQILLGFELSVEELKRKLDIALSEDEAVIWFEDESALKGLDVRKVFAPDEVRKMLGDLIGDIGDVALPRVALVKWREGLDRVEGIRAVYRDTAKRVFFSKLRQLFLKYALVFRILFIAVVMIIAFIQIRISVFAHATEIEIMRLVGATEWFIKWPFVFYAFFVAVTSILISVLMWMGVATAFDFSFVIPVKVLARVCVVILFSTFVSALLSV